MKNEDDFDLIFRKTKDAKVEYVWHMTQDQYKRLRSKRDSEGKYLWEPDFNSSNGRIAGMRVFIVPWDLPEPEVAIILPPETDCYGDPDWVSQNPEKKMQPPPTTEYVRKPRPPKSRWIRDRF